VVHRVLGGEEDASPRTEQDQILPLHLFVAIAVVVIVALLALIYTCPAEAAALGRTAKL